MGKSLKPDWEKSVWERWVEEWADQPVAWPVQKMATVIKYLVLAAIAYFAWLLSSSP